MKEQSVGMSGGTEPGRAQETTDNRALAVSKFAVGKLAVSSWSWHAAYYAGAWSLLDLPPAAASTDIAAIECNDFMLPPPRFSRVRRPLLSLLPGAPPELWRYSRATLRELFDRAVGSGLSILAWTVNSDFTVPARHWPVHQLYLRRGLAAARQLQAPLLRVNLGGSPDTPPACDELIVRRLAEFVGHSQRLYPAVTITVENHWGVSTDIDRHLRLFDRVAGQLAPALQKRFGCCFDPGNMPVGPERERWWPSLAARANHYHLKTRAFTADGQETTLPHETLFALLQENGYQGNVTIEYAGDGLAAEGVRQSAALFLARVNGRPDPP
jgi:sugar phosphate isomerase/epimerase